MATDFTLLSPEVLLSRLENLPVLSFDETNEEESDSSSSDEEESDSSNSEEEESDSSNSEEEESDSSNSDEEESNSLLVKRQEYEEVVNARIPIFDPIGGKGEIEPGVMVGGDGISVSASVNYILTEEQRVLFLTGEESINAAGNNQANYIEGNAGNNVQQGNDGNDVLIGNAGDDALAGGNGIDILIGGPGVDRFILNAPAVSADIDYISDFSVLEGDKIRVSASEFGIETNAYNRFEFDVANQVLRFDGNAIAAFGSDTDFSSGSPSLEAAIEIV